MLSRALRMAFWVVYDHLGKLMLANGMWALSFLVPGFFCLAAFEAGDPGVMMWVGLPLFVLTVGVVLPVMTAGMAHMTKHLVDSKDGSVGDFFAGIRMYWRRAAGIGVILLLSVVCLGVSVWFYAAKLQHTAPLLGYAASALAFWVLLFVLLTSILVMPALVQKKAGIFATLKLSAMLVLANPLFCAGLAVQFVAVLLFSMIPIVLVLFTGATAMAMATSAYEMLARKYAAIQAERTGEPPESGPIHVISKGGVLVFDDAQDDYLNRGLRDALFPWKG